VACWPVKQNINYFKELTINTDKDIKKIIGLKVKYALNDGNDREVAHGLVTGEVIVKPVCNVDGAYDREIVMMARLV
jgi:hypothetical protein